MSVLDEITTFINSLHRIHLGLYYEQQNDHFSLEYHNQE